MIRQLIVLIFIGSLTFAAVPVNPATVPQELEGVGIEEKLGTQLDLGLKFMSSDGHPVPLSSFFSQKGRPVALVFAYYTCPMLCSMVLNGASQSFRELPWTIGKEFDVVTISIDPRDDWQIAAKKKSTYLTNYERSASGWNFLADYAGNAKVLADQVGFKYKWDPTKEQYAHAAGMVILTPEGKVSRYLYGVKFKSRDLRLSLTEASESRAGASFEQFLLYCFHYDPNARSYVFFATNLMRGGGVMVVLILGTVLWRLFRAENQNLRTAL